MWRDVDYLKQGSYLPTESSGSLVTVLQRSVGSTIRMLRIRTIRWQHRVEINKIPLILEWAHLFVDVNEWSIEWSGSWNIVNVNEQNWKKWIIKLDKSKLNLFWSNLWKIFLQNCKDVTLWQFHSNDWEIVLINSRIILFWDSSWVNSWIISWKESEVEIQWFNYWEVNLEWDFCSISISEPVFDDEIGETVDNDIWKTFIYCKNYWVLEILMNDWDKQTEKILVFNIDLWLFKFKWKEYNLDQLSILEEYWFRCDVEAWVLTIAFQDQKLVFSRKRLELKSVKKATKQTKINTTDKVAMITDESE